MCVCVCVCVCVICKRLLCWWLLLFLNDLIECEIEFTRKFYFTRICFCFRIF